MKVYLDACCLNRPFDDQTQSRVRLETEAVLLVLKQIDLGKFSLCNSEVLDFENQANPDLNKQTKVVELLKRTQEYTKMTKQIEERAEQLVKLEKGIKPLDALHVASAEVLNADILLTCDDQFLKASRRLEPHMRVKVLNPTEFV
ncbi:PIN domain-containing protein [Candidatus Acetothermia bacterium]|nr:PIN domain-containing protein [Candidatus Acetothermia bacterium]